MRNQEIEMIMDKSQNLLELIPKIAVFGVGGAGGNALKNMKSSGLLGVDFVACNTDAQAISQSKIERWVQLGVKSTKGLGAGSKPSVGKKAAEESVDEIIEQLNDVDMVFIAAGMGGGTGTGAAPVIAKLAREREILTIAVVTTPFDFEGSVRQSLAKEGIIELEKYVDTLLVLPNQNLFNLVSDQTSLNEAFSMADHVLYNAVRSVTDLMMRPGLINLDFADVQTVMTDMGYAIMGTGEASGDDRSYDASLAAISNPLLGDVSIYGAKGLLVNITGGSDMTLMEIDRATTTIREQVDPEANIIVGASFDESLSGSFRVSVVATGLKAFNNLVEGNERALERKVKETKKPNRSFNNMAMPEVERSYDRMVNQMSQNGYNNHDADEMNEYDASTNMNEGSMERGNEFNPVSNIHQRIREKINYQNSQDNKYDNNEPNNDDWAFKSEQYQNQASQRNEKSFNRNENRQQFNSASHSRSSSYNQNRVRNQQVFGQDEPQRKMVTKENPYAKRSAIGGFFSNIIGGIKELSHSPESNENEENLVSNVNERSYVNNQNKQMQTAPVEKSFNNNFENSFENEYHEEEHKDENLFSNAQVRVKKKNNYSKQIDDREVPAFLQKNKIW